MPAGEILPSPHGTSLAAPDLEQRKEMGLSPAATTKPSAPLGTFPIRGAPSAPCRGELTPD